MRENDPCLRLLYTSLELIRSSRVLAAGSVMCCLWSLIKALVSFESLSFLTGVCGQCHSRTDCRGFQIDRLLRRAALRAALRACDRPVT